MAKGKQSRGACAFCGREMTRGGFYRHLPACPKRDAAIEAAGEKRRPERLYHLVVEDTYSNVFWLHLEVRGSAKLEDLDRYLRAIWLECCGHLSAFFMGGPWNDDLPMSRTIDAVFSQTDELGYVYDFGTSSELLIKVAGVREGVPLTKHPIFLMARNEMPSYVCQECGEPATQLCLECVYEYDRPGLLCDEHAEEHECESYGEAMAVVNSPRVGMCGYSGPAEPPY